MIHIWIHLSWNLQKVIIYRHWEKLPIVTGKRFIDHINFNSSIGYPLGGKKSKYMKGYPTQYDFDSDIFVIDIGNNAS